ncbi:YxeA family protein, partial [Staphylococcus aureus]|uniref:YxeA family protein n=1 Tax=Staphylococcus aureus TaxID=1280 RepID=UPI002108A64B
MKFIIAILLGLIVSITIAFTIIHHPILDRFNPFLQTAYSYDKVPKGTQQYVNITAYSERGGPLDSKLT